MRKTLDYQAITEYYLKRSQQIVAQYPNPVVLKTDLFNEAENYPVPGGIAGNLQAHGVFGIEIDPEVVARAKEKLKPNTDVFCDQGDIRELLEAYTEYFDVILDLSTIDHVWPEDIEKVIKGYYRVLSPGGIVLLIVWLDTDNDHTEHSIGKYKQNMLGYNQVREEMSKSFTIESEKTLFSDFREPNQSLIEFILTK